MGSKPPSNSSGWIATRWRRASRTAGTAKSTAKIRQGEPGPVEMEDRGIVFQVDAKGEIPFEASTTLTIRCEASEGEKWLALATRIRVHGDEVLDPYASGLTTPEILWPLSLLTRDTTIEIRYDAGLHPQIV